MSPYFLSVMLGGGGGGGENPNVILIRNVAFLRDTISAFSKLRCFFIRYRINLRRNIHAMMMHICI